MRRFTGMTARTGIRPSAPAGNASPSAWDTGRLYIDGQFAATADVQVARAASTPMRADTFRLFLAGTMTSRLGVSLARREMTPCQSIWWRGMIGVEMSARFDGFARRSGAAPTRYALDRFNTASNAVFRSESFALYGGRLFTRTDMLSERTAEGMAFRTEVAIPAGARLRNGSDLHRRYVNGGMPTRLLLSVMGGDRMAARADLSSGRVAADLASRSLHSIPVNARTAVRLDSWAVRIMADLAIRYETFTSARTCAALRADLLAGGIVSGMPSQFGLSTGRVTRAPMGSDIFRRILANRQAGEWYMAAPAVARFAAQTDAWMGRTAESLPAYTALTVRSLTGFHTHAGMEMRRLAGMLSASVAVYQLSRMTLATRLDEYVGSISAGIASMLGLSTARGTGNTARFDGWRSALAAGLHGYAGINVSGGCRQTAMSDLGRLFAWAAVPAGIILRAPNRTGGVAWLDLNPARHGDALATLLAHSVPTPMRLVSASGLERNHIPGRLSLAYGIRQPRTAEIRALPAEVWREMVAEAMTAWNDRLGNRIGVLANAAEVTPNGIGVSGWAAWNIRASGIGVLPADCDIFRPRLSTPGSAAVWTFRRMAPTIMGSVWTGETAAVTGILATLATTRLPAGMGLAIGFDAYGRETKTQWGAPFRFDIRPFAMQASPASWDVHRPSHSTPALHSAWILRSPQRDNLRWAGYPPPDRVARWETHWHTRVATEELLDTAFEITLREYVRDLTLFSAQWAVGRTPNATPQYGPGGVYGNWGRYWIGLGVRSDTTRDGRLARFVARGNLRGGYFLPTTGATWDIYEGGASTTGPMARFDYAGAAPPASGMVAGWDWRPFGAIAEHFAEGHHVLCPAGITLVARDTATGVETTLGFIAEDSLDAGQGVLSDVALPDGEYEIEARVASFFWPEARPGTAAVYHIEAGVAPQVQLPAVVDLHAVMTSDWWRHLTWSVAGDVGDTPFALGVWFGDTAPVDLASDPAVVIPRTPGLDYYEHFHQQAAPIHVAVAAFTADGARGRAGELFLDWDASNPEAPTYQWATEKEDRIP